MFNADQIIATSQSFIESQPRYKLGAMALPTDMVVSKDAVMRLGVIEESTGNELGAGDYWTFKYLSDELESRMRHNTNPYHLLTEVMFWWTKMPHSVSEGYRKVIDDNSSIFVTNRMAKLTLMFDHPELHEYFNAGYWDLEQVQMFHENDIDPLLVEQALSA